MSGLSIPLAVIPTPASQWTEGVVYGLGDPVAEARVLNRTLSEWHAGATPAKGTLAGPALIVAEDLWVSRELPAAMAKSAPAGRGPFRLGRAADGPGRFADPLGRLPRTTDEGRELILFDVWYVPVGSKVDLGAFQAGELPAVLANAPTIDIDTRTYSIDLPIDPELLGVDELSLEVGAAVASPVSHWAEIVRTNLLAIGTIILGTSVWLAVLRLIWAAIRSLSLNPFRILGALTRRGRRCKIHPTAVVEGCTLGDGVEIDAGAVVRGCLVGDGAKIGSNATLEFSVVASGARVYRNAVANLSVLYPGARVGGIVQLGLCGEGSANKMFAVGTDMRLGGPVRVTSPDGLKSVDIGYHGVCFGHRSFVGSGVWIAPGRIIDADARVVRDRELTIT